MFPFEVIALAGDCQLLVDLKNGDTYIGTLCHVDSFMNLRLKDVLRTSKDGRQFWKMTEIYIRGFAIQNMRLPDCVMEDAARIVQYQQERQRQQHGNFAKLPIKKEYNNNIASGPRTRIATTPRNKVNGLQGPTSN